MSCQLLSDPAAGTIGSRAHPPRRRLTQAAPMALPDLTGTRPLAGDKRKGRTQIGKAAETGKRRGPLVNPAPLSELTCKPDQGQHRSPSLSAPARLTGKLTAVLSNQSCPAPPRLRPVSSKRALDGRPCHCDTTNVPSIGSNARSYSPSRTPGYGFDCIRTTIRSSAGRTWISVSRCP